MKIQNKGTIRVELTDHATEKVVKQVFNNVKPEQSDQAILKLGEVVGALAKETATVNNVYQIVEYLVMSE